MDAVRDLLLQVAEIIVDYLPRIGGAVLILLVGWLVAAMLAGLTRRLLSRVNIDNQIASFIRGDQEGDDFNVENWVGSLVFYLVMLLVLIGVFQTLRLTIITEPLNELLSQIMRYIPRLGGAAILLAIAWGIATGLKFLITRGLNAAKLEERLGEQAGIEDEERVPLSQTIAEAAYWLVFLLFLPSVLDALALDGLLRPVQSMVDEILAFLPNLLGAGIILAVGWFAARIIQRIVTNVLAAFGIDQLSERIGLTTVLGQQKLSGVIGIVLYVLIFIPVIIAALNTLGLDAITQPASNMLGTILEAIPAVFGAALVIIIAYVVARLVTGLITNLLTNIGFNNITARLGLNQIEGGRTPAEVVGYLLQVGILLFAAIEASRLLGFDLLANLMAQFTVFAGQIILGLIIFAIALYLANLASRTITESGLGQARLLGMAARVSILVLGGAMALRQMGLANEIVNLAFGLLLGAIAVASALAFGLGGRDIAGRELESWVQSTKTKEE